MDSVLGRKQRIKNSDWIETFDKIEQLITKEELDQLGPTFHERLFELIGQSGMENKEIWKAANLDRKHFSKIQCDAGYHPKKKTVMALCIALKLNLEQAVDLMARADWAFSPSSKFDLILFHDHIHHNIYFHFRLISTFFQK